MYAVKVFYTNYSFCRVEEMPFDVKVFYTNFPFCRVDGKPFDVKVFYTNDFAKQLGCHLPQALKDEARLTLEARNLGVKLIHYLDTREEKERGRRIQADGTDERVSSCFVR